VQKCSTDNRKWAKSQGGRERANANITSYLEHSILSAGRNKVRGKNSKNQLREKQLQ